MVKFIDPKLGGNNLSKPVGVANAIGDVLKSVAPKMDPDNYNNELGILETGNVNMELEKAKPINLRKKKKSTKPKRKCRCKK